MSIILFQDITVQYMDEGARDTAVDLQKQFKILKSKLNYYYNTCEIDGRLVHRMIDYLESELEKKAEVFPIPEDFQRAALVEYFETGKRGHKKTVHYVRKKSM